MFWKTPIRLGSDPATTTIHGVVAPNATWVSFFQAALFDSDPWTTVGREALWLVGLGAGYGLLARAAARRLLA